MSRPATKQQHQQPIMDPKAMELTKPGQEHQELAKLAGTWDVSCAFWMDPDAPPIRSTGTCTYHTVFDGRFLEGEFTGDLGGQPFAGRSIMGYDRPAKRYFSSWYDSMATGFTCLTGTSSDGGRTITYTGETTCHTDERPRSVRQVESHPSDDRCTITMFQTLDGQESKTMELEYRRH
jgi:hypothetical protein